MQPEADVKASSADQIWPASPAAAGADLLALQHQLRFTERLSPAEQTRQQSRQLLNLLRHAHRTVPHFQHALDERSLVRGVLAEDDWQRVPLLSRTAIARDPDRFRSHAIPLDHGAIRSSSTTGSTTTPLVVHGTELNQFLVQAIVIRDHLWHRRDLRGKLATINTYLKPGRASAWSGAIAATFHNGPAVQQPDHLGVERLVHWLVAEDPDYLVAHVSTTQAMAEYSLSKQLTLPRLKDIRTIGEPLREGMRDLCREAWNAEIVDLYSCAEMGPLALQCPVKPIYHVQSEFVRLEVLDENGAPCPPGATGRVVVTALHNFAMPLIRYELGDYATVGEQCPCGRTLPVLARIMGRARNMVRVPDGRMLWPSVKAESWTSVPGITGFQLVQTELDHFVLRLVAEDPLTDAQCRTLFDRLRRDLTYPFDFTVEYVNEIARSGHKIEDVVSKMSLDHAGNSVP